MHRLLLVALDGKQQFLGLGVSKGLKFIVAAHSSSTQMSGADRCSLLSSDWGIVHLLFVQQTNSNQTHKSADEASVV